MEQLLTLYSEVQSTDVRWLWYNYDQIAMILTQKKRSTLRGRQEWNGVMVANIMKNERRWGDLEARKSIVVDYKLPNIELEKELPLSVPWYLPGTGKRKIPAL